MNKQAKRTPICVVFFLDFDFSEYKRKCKIEKIEKKKKRKEKKTNEKKKIFELLPS